MYFVGAALSCALGLPNTPMLLDGVVDLASHRPRWGEGEKLPEELQLFDPGFDMVVKGS